MVYIRSISGNRGVVVFVLALVSGHKEESDRRKRREVIERAEYEKAKEWLDK